jgi:LPS-assembly protein
VWKIDGLRHLITPRVGYRYIPEADRGRARIPAIDREVFSTYLLPLGLGAARNIDDLHAAHVVRLGFDNTLQTRDPVHGSRDLVLFNVANDFRLKRRPGERTASEVHAELSLMPASWLQLDAYQSVSPRNFTLREFNSGIKVHDGDAWSVRFANNYLRRELEDYLVDGRIRINEAFETLVRVHYDARRRRLNEQSYGIVQNLANTWLISYTVNLYSGRRRESGVGFNIQVDTVRF